MPVLTLPDGSTREFDRPVTGLEVALGIGKKLAKDAAKVELEKQLDDNLDDDQKKTLNGLKSMFDK